MEDTTLRTPYEGHHIGDKILELCMVSKNTKIQKFSKKKIENFLIFFLKYLAVRVTGVPLYLGVRDSNLQRALQPRNTVPNLEVIG